MGLTKADQDELDSLKAYDNAPVPLTAEEQQELAALNREEERMRKVDPPQESTAAYLGRKLNVIPGTTRALVGQALGKKVDYNKAFAGKQPGTAEMYGINPVAGFAADMVQDPTMLILGGAGKLLSEGTNLAANAGVRALSAGEAAAAASMAKPSSLRALLAAVAKHTQPREIIQDGLLMGTKPAVNVLKTPVRQGLRAAGRGLYKSSLSELERAAPGSTDILFDMGVKTTASGAGKKVGRAIEGLDQANTEIASRASQQGALVDVGEAMGPVRSKMRELNVAPNNRPHVMAQEPWVSSYEDMAQASMNDALLQQQSLRQMAKEAYRDPVGASAKSQIAQAGNRGMGIEIGNTLERVADPGTAQIYRANNVKMGKLINAEKTAQGMRSAPILTAGDAAAGTAGFFGLGGYMGGVKGVMLKRAIQGLTGPAVGTYGGRALNLLGKTPMLEQGLIQTGVRAASPWTLLDEETGDGRLP